MSSIQLVILKHFPMLTDWLSQRMTGADLIFTEGVVVSGTILELLRGYGAPSFRVHGVVLRKSATCS